jgi:hypothetical protein
MEKMDFWRPVILMIQRVGAGEVYERISCVESCRMGKFPGPWKGPYCERKRIRII